MRFLKIIYVTCFVLLFFSVGFSLATALIPLRSVIGDVFTREYFVKRMIKVEAKDGSGGRSQRTVSYCIINSKKLGIQDTDADTLKVDSCYYAWHNTKTDKVYLTDGKSQYYDVYGNLVHMIEIESSAVLVSLLLFFTMRFIDRRVK